MKRLYILIRYRVPMYLVQLLTSWFPNFGVFTKIRGLLMKPFFKKCGSGFRIASGVILNNSERLEIGDNVYIAHNVWINSFGGCRIGSNVQISPMVVISTSKHTKVDGAFYGPSLPLPVTIGSGVWIASHVTVTGGVCIGGGTVIGANSVVTKDIPSDSFAVGLPAQLKIKYKR